MLVKLECFFHFFNVFTGLPDREPINVILSLLFGYFSGFEINFEVMLCFLYLFFC